MRTKMHYVRADDRSRGGDHPHYYRPERLQSRASSIFGNSGQQTTAAAGFPYRFVFPANHPALSGPVYSQYMQQQHPEQPEQLFSAEDMYTAPSTRQHPLSNQKHPHLQYQQHHQLGYDFFGGGGGGAKHQPYQVVKQPKHYQNYELAPGIAAAAGHPQPPYSPAPAQPIMLLIPSSGQPGAPYQTLVLVPSTAGHHPPPSAHHPVFAGFQPQMQQQLQSAPQFLQPGFVTHPRGAPTVVGYPSGLGKFPGTAQLFHRSHETHQQRPPHHPHHKPPPAQSTSYQGSGSAHMPHATASGAAEASQQPLEDKVSVSTGVSAENSEAGSSGEQTKSDDEKKPPTPEFGDRTSTKPPPKRIVVT